MSKLKGIIEVSQEENDEVDTNTKKASLYALDTADITKKRLTATSSGDKVGLDVSDVAVLTAIQNITIPAPAGGATEAKQDVGLSLIPWLKTILAKIATPAWYDPTANVIRNQVQSGTITTVTTVTTTGTLTTLANIDGYQGKLQIINQNNSAWANVVRARIS